MIYDNWHKWQIRVLGKFVSRVQLIDWADLAAKDGVEK